MSRNPASAWRHIDMVLVGSILSVSALGCLMIFSATRGRDPSDFDTSFLLKQGLFVAGGVVAMLVTTLVDYRRYRDLVTVAYLGVLSLLRLVVSALGIGRASCREGGCQ